MEKIKTLAELIEMSKQQTKELEKLQRYFSNEMKELERDIQELENKHNNIAGVDFSGSLNQLNNL